MMVRKLIVLNLVWILSSNLEASVVTRQIGVWRTDCVVFGRHSYISSATFTDKHLTLVTNFFATQDCQTQTITGLYEGKFWGRNHNANQVFLVHEVESTQFMLHQEDVVSQWNNSDNEDGCELPDWKLMVPQEVSGRYCRPFTMPKMHEHIFDFLFYDPEGNLSFARSPAIVGELNGELETVLPADVKFKKIQ